MGLTSVDVQKMCSIELLQKVRPGITQIPQVAKLDYRFGILPKHDRMEVLLAAPFVR